MKTLVTLPNNLDKNFIKNYKDLFVFSETKDIQLGSGGGISNILKKYRREKNEKLLIINSGGENRKLPAYAITGSIFTPIPVYRWKTGQKINQCIFDLQTDFCSNIIEKTNNKQNLIISAGDVILNCKKYPKEIPDADIVIISTWIDSSIAINHGVLFARNNSQNILDFSIQKPTAEKIESLLSTHVFMLDTGCWILSDKAVEILTRKCEPVGKQFYDIYKSFGESLGTNPIKYDKDISNLTCAIVNLDNGAFYHYGTSKELITSTQSIQNFINDPREIYKRSVHSQPSIFLQNCHIDIEWGENKKNIWIENSYVGKGWNLDSETIITGMPKNDWNIYIPKGICIDVIPIDDNSYCLRPYGINDTFSGKINNNKTKWMGKEIPIWVKKDSSDIFYTKLFPVLNKTDFEQYAQQLISWMINSNVSEDLFEEYNKFEHLSSADIFERVNLNRLFEQRKNFLKENLVLLAKNYKKSVFYQCDLNNSKNLYKEFNLNYPESISNDNDYITRIRAHMFKDESNLAFNLLKERIIANIDKAEPKYDLKQKQIICGKSPVRIDLAGGWSDTSPYSICYGGNVVNIAVDLNDQAPIQVYIKHVKELCFIIRSIELGMETRISTFEELEDYKDTNSFFSIPKIALCMSGFSNLFCKTKYTSLIEHLKKLGGGLEITIITTVPYCSGLGTSSILASTLIASLSEVCLLNLTKQDICYRVFALEHLLTNYSGWQNQYGAEYGGVKTCSSISGLQNDIEVRYLPNDVFTNNETKDLWMLYYTGITRDVNNIHNQIVKNMIMNDSNTISICDEIKANAIYTSDLIQFNDYIKLAKSIKQSWSLSKKLNKNISNEQIDKIIDIIEPYTYGYKLIGAGGGGYILICAKNKECMLKIQDKLNKTSKDNKARFIKMSINQIGLQITRI